MNYLIHNCDVYTSHDIVENGLVLIKGSRIERIFPSSYNTHDLNLATNINRIDAKGGVVIPGFIDLHVHGGYNVDVTNESTDELSKMVNFHLKNGSTGLLLTTLSGSSINELKNQVKTLSRMLEFHESVLGIHLEGPFLNPQFRGMFPADAFRKPSLNELKELVEISENTIRMITIAPELDGALDIINWCSQNGIIASFGHSGADYETVRKAINLGLKHTTHVFNAMVPLHHRHPGGLGAALMDDRLSVQVICDGIHLHPLIIQMLVRLKGHHNICLITDANRSAGMPDGEYPLGNFGTVYYRDGRV
ncbi:N-acetylglucosamine-6-phosphate deacetylase, partial [bacterium]|nr:N-acetylglucosamine-6-phosphate deacetylase [bacterium]